MSLPVGAILDDEEPQRWHAEPVAATASDAALSAAADEDAEGDNGAEEEDDEQMRDEEGEEKEEPWQGASSGGAAEYAARYAAAAAAGEDDAALVDEQQLDEGQEEDDGEEQPLPPAGDLTAAFFSELAASQSYKKRGGNGGDGGEGDDSDEEYGVVQARAFAIPQHLLRSYDPNSTAPPASAEEYLLRVRMEAAACPKVKVSDIDPRQYAHKQTRYMPNLGEVPRPQNEACLPSERWQNHFAADFAQARQQLLCFSANNSALRKAAQHAVPNKRDYFGWMTYAVGNVAQQMAEAAASFAAAAGQSSVAAPAFASPSPLPHVPSLPVLVAMDQIQTKGILTQLMQLGVDTVQKRKNQVERASSGAPPLPPFPFPTHAYTLWLYALMLKVDKPLVSTVSSGMRALYRSLSWLRAHHNTPASAEVKHANMLLTLLDRAFGQAVQWSEQQAHEQFHLRQQYLRETTSPQQKVQQAQKHAAHAAASSASVPLLPHP